LAPEFDMAFGVVDDWGLSGLSVRLLRARQIPGDDGYEKQREKQRSHPRSRSRKEHYCFFFFFLSRV